MKGCGFVVDSDRLGRSKFKVMVRKLSGLPGQA